MKIRVITFLISVVLLLIIGLGIFIYKMPYPFATYYQLTKNGPTLKDNIVRDEFDLMWAQIKNHVSYYELPYEMYVNKDGDIELQTLTSSSRDNKSKHGVIYYFEKKDGRWFWLDNLKGGWGTGVGSFKGRTYH